MTDSGTGEPVNSTELVRGTPGWARYVGSDGCVIAMETSGSSTPLKELQRRFGFTPDRVAKAVREQGSCLDVGMRDYIRRSLITGGQLGRAGA